MTVVAVYKFGDDSCQLQFVTYLRLTQKCLKCNQKVPLPPGYDSPEQRCTWNFSLRSYKPRGIVLQRVVHTSLHAERSV